MSTFINSDNRPTTEEVGLEINTDKVQRLTPRPLSNRLRTLGVVGSIAAMTLLVACGGFQQLSPAEQTAVADIRAARSVATATPALAAGRPDSAATVAPAATRLAVAPSPTVDNRAASGTPVPAGQPDLKPGYFVVGNSNGVIGRVVESQGSLGQIYRTIVTDNRPEHYGLPAETTRFQIPRSLQEYRDMMTSNNRQWEIREYFNPANRGLFGNLIPERSCWIADAKPYPWCGQSWDLSMAVGNLTDNIKGTQTIPARGQWSVAKIDQGKGRAVYEGALLLNPEFADDGRYAEATEILPGSDVFLRFKGLPPGSVIFATDPVNGRYLDLPGHLISEGTEGGIVLPVAAKNTKGAQFSAIGWVVAYDMKPERKDSNHEFGLSRGPTAARPSGTQHNLLDARNKGVAVPLS